jgi:hypothetical protein
MSSSNAIAVGARESSQERDADVRAAKALGKTDSFLDAPRTSRDHSPFEQGGVAPESVSRTLGGRGSALSSEQREDYGTAFGADFGDVRIHSGEDAERSAREVGAPAYSVGRDVVMTNGLENPTSPEGRKVLGHELAHVAQSQQEPGPPVLRRVGFFESVARFFGGGTFEKGELITYLNWLESNPGKIEDNNDSDNKARALVSQGMHKDRKLDTRAQLIGELRSGYVAGDDQDAILKILDDATPAERFELLRNKLVMGVEKDLSGDRLKKYWGVVEQVDKGKPYPVPTAWRFEYAINGASQDRDQLGIALDTFNIRPDEAADPVSVAGPSDVILKPGETTMMNASLPHPRDRAGEAFLQYQVGQVAGEGLTPVAKGREEPHDKYKTIDNDIAGVTTRLDVDLASQEAGDTTKKQDDTTAQSTTTGHQESTETGVTDSQQTEVGVKRAQKRATTASVSQTEGATVGQDVEKSHQTTDTKKDETETSSKNKDETSKTHGSGSSHTDSDSTTKGEETTNLDFDGKVDDGEAKAKITQETKGAPLWKKVSKWALKKVLEYVKDPRIKLLAPLVDLIDTDSTSLEWNVDGTFKLHIKLKGEAKRKWEESTKTSSDTTGKSDSTTATKGTETGTAERKGTEHSSSEGDKTTDRAEVRKDVTAGGSATQEKSAEVERKKTEGKSTTTSKGSQTSKSDTKSSSTTKGTAERRSVFRAVIKSSKLSFTYLHGSAQPKAPDPMAGGSDKAKAPAGGAK